jgi:dihydroorotate dehydrogenase electron transfer subunit
MENMKPKQLTGQLSSLKRIKPDVFGLSFNSVFLAKNSQPGQFLHIKINKVILRRPFSINSIKGNTIRILFRVKGRGTKLLSQYKKSQKLNIIGPLGKGFDCEGRKTRDERRILVAGGLGVAPLLFLAERLNRLRQTTDDRRQTIVLLGAKSKKEILSEKEFKKLGCKVLVATEDGSKGIKGTAINLLKKQLRTTLARRSLGEGGNYKLRTNIYSCGPEPMFKEINKIIARKKNINCQVSFEQFMGCGLGICCGCTIKTKHGYKKACKDGPVFNIRDIW